MFSTASQLPPHQEEEVEKVEVGADPPTSHKFWGPKR